MFCFYRSLLVDLCGDFSPCFLITLKKIADWLHLAFPNDIYITEHGLRRKEHGLRGRAWIRTWTEGYRASKNNNFPIS